MSCSTYELGCTPDLIYMFLYIYIYTYYPSNGVPLVGEDKGPWSLSACDLGCELHGFESCVCTVMGPWGPDDCN